MTLEKLKEHVINLIAIYGGDKLIYDDIDPCFFLANIEQDEIANKLHAIWQDESKC